MGSGPVRGLAGRYPVLPVILRPVMRNLPLVAAIAAAGFVLTRKPETEAGASEMPMQPAE